MEKWNPACRLAGMECWKDGNLTLDFGIRQRIKFIARKDAMIASLDGYEPFDTPA